MYRLNYEGYGLERGTSGLRRKREIGHAIEDEAVDGDENENDGS